MANDDGGELDVVAAAASERRAPVGDQLDVVSLLAGKRRVGEASSSKEVREGVQKKAMPLLCHLKSQERSLPIIRMTAMKMGFCLVT